MQADLELTAKMAILDVLIALDVAFIVTLIELESFYNHLRGQVYSVRKLALGFLAFMAFSLILISPITPGDQGQIPFLAEETLIMSITSSKISEANFRDRGTAITDLDFMRCNFHDYPSGVCDQNLDKSRDSFDPRWRPWYLARFVNEVAAVLLEAGASMSAHDDFLRQHYDVLSSVDLFEDGFMKPLGVEYQKYDRDLLHRCFHHGHVTQATQVAKESTASGFNFNQTGRISESFSSSFESTGPSQLKNWVSRPECVPNSGPDHSPNQHTDPHPNRTVVLSRALNTTQTIAVAMILVIVVINLLVTRLTIPASSHRNAPSTHDDVDFKLTHLLSGSLDIVSVEDITGFMALLEGDLYPGMPDVQLEGYANEANLHIWHEQQIVQVTRSKHLQGDPSDVTSPNDDLMNTLAPLFMTQIENALEPVLGPVITALQNQGEEERMQRQKLIAQEEKKLALKREKVQRLKRHRACRFQPTRRARATNSSAKSPQLTLRQGLSLLKSSQSSAVKLSRVELLD